jgi:2-dehydro-3-deoxygluconokinase
MEAVTLGEAMVEFARREDGLYLQGFGGDTFNAAAYLARLGVPTAFATAVGDDPYSAALLARMAAEGVGDATRRAPGRSLGLYTIETDAEGERSFHYWRDRAPVRDLFGPLWDEGWAEGLLGARLLLLSGITLAVCGDEGLPRLLDLLAALRARGGRVAFDANWRPRLWPGRDPRGPYAEVLRRADIALMTADEAAAVWGVADPAAAAARARAEGLAEVAIKRGPLGCLLAWEGGEAEIPVPELVRPVDTTAAGDSFGAAYLAARLRGAGPAAAALAGHRLAARVIAHRGAVIPRAAMAELMP